MRLLNVFSYELKEFFGSNIPEYAILSHTWEEEEILFADLRDSTAREAATRKKGWQKVSGTCRRARDDGLDWVWIDTCCINKEGSAELSEALNSMFRYYLDSFVCYAYLSDYRIMVAGYPNTKTGNATFESCRWFTRGWTLQELLAPADIVFFDAEWKDMGSRLGLRDAISKVTGIPTTVLKDGDIEDISIAAKMSWAADRQTTREEDRAYSLMGLFGVNMPPLYGEGGPSAFLRLQEEIIKFSNDQSIFAWSTPSVTSAEDERRGLLAKSPSEFKACGDIRVLQDSLDLPYSLTNNGMHIYLPLERAFDFPDPGVEISIAYLRCGRFNEDGRLAILLRKLKDQQYERWHPDWLLRLPQHRLASLTIEEIYVKEVHRPLLMRPRRHPFDSSMNSFEYATRPVDNVVSVFSHTTSIDPKNIRPVADEVPTTGAHILQYKLDRSDSDEEPITVSVWFARKSILDSFSLTPLHDEHDRIVLPFNEDEWLLVTLRKEYVLREGNRARCRLEFDIILTREGQGLGYASSEELLQSDVDPPSLSLATPDQTQVLVFTELPPPEGPYVATAFKVENPEELWSSIENPNDNVDMEWEYIGSFTSSKVAISTLTSGCSLLWLQYSLLSDLTSFNLAPLSVLRDRQWEHETSPELRDSRPGLSVVLEIRNGLVRWWNVLPFNEDPRNPTRDKVAVTSMIRKYLSHTGNPQSQIEVPGINELANFSNPDAGMYIYLGEGRVNATWVQLEYTCTKNAQFMDQNLLRIMIGFDHAQLRYDEGFINDLGEGIAMM
ncbi:hypothetical protein D9758_012902 [Tetrapyrgos nigripes]|uniref:Heterokaryon incompatibility domain-containing protein n=1 Tax=Tetrapyrgos nigripes TaxID=182062 RepID=A0A8H5CLG3_9AGAR|nr:hypothetical protein D9758_012902 [Tetrapyrgos nigripes]